MIRVDSVPSNQRERSAPPLSHVSREPSSYSQGIIQWIRQAEELYAGFMSFKGKKVEFFAYGY